MRVWLIKEGEPLPLEGCTGRIMRCGIISRMLAERGHDVTWWSSTYSHQMKKYIRPEECTENVLENYKIKLLHAKTVYKRNISLSRIIYHKQLAKKFLEEAYALEKPDVIYCSYPTIDFAFAAVKYAIENNVPVIVDVRDYWPDIYVQPFPKVIHPWVRLLFKNYEKMARYAIQNATTIVGVVPFAIDWARGKGRKENNLDHTVFLAYDQLSTDECEFSAYNYWSNMGLAQDDNIICYFGNIIDRVDFNSVISAAKILKEKGIKCKFVICGNGAYLRELIEKTVDLNFIFPGFIDQNKIETLMQISIAGLLPYFNTDDFFNAVPNKAIEYLAGGLPILSSLQGYLKIILDKNDCGLTHANGEELAHNIDCLINQEEKLLNMKSNAKSLYKSDFTADEIYGGFCEFITSLAT